VAKPKRWWGDPTRKLTKANSYGLEKHCTGGQGDKKFSLLGRIKPSKWRKKQSRHGSTHFRNHGKSSSGGPSQNRAAAGRTAAKGEHAYD